MLALIEGELLLVDGLQRRELLLDDRGQRCDRAGAARRSLTWGGRNTFLLLVAHRTLPRFERVDRLMPVRPGCLDGMGALVILLLPSVFR